MSCLCKNQLAASLDRLKNLPIAALAHALNQLTGPLNAILLMAPRVSANLAARASLDASMAATASAMASAQANFSASALARLEALGAVHTSLGLGALNARVQARLAATITSMNQVLPALLAALEQALAPLAAALEKLRTALASLAGIRALTGLNLLLPNQAFLLPPLPTVTALASARARAQLMASARVAVTASARATANAMLALRLQAAAMALGFSLPQGALSLQASLRLAAALPPLQLPAAALAALQRVAAMIAALVETAIATGISLLTPMAPTSLLAALGIAQANLSATLMGSATASAAATAAVSASASAMANATAAVNANAVLNAAAGLNLGGIPNLLPISLTASLAANLQSLLGIAPFQSSRCGSCVLRF